MTAATMTVATTTAVGTIAILTAETRGATRGATIGGKAAALTVAEAMSPVGMLGSEVGRQSVRINGGAIVADMAGMRVTTAASLVVDMAGTTTEMMAVAATTTDLTVAAQTAETGSRLLQTAVLHPAIARAAVVGAIRRIAWRARYLSAGTRSR